MAEIDAGARLTPPVAVRKVDLDSGEDLDLARDGKPYRSAMLVAVRAGRPYAVATVGLNGSPRLSARTLAELFAHDAPCDPPELVRDAPLTSVSVVVTTCAQAESVASAVASVLACDPPPREVIVVENRPDGSPVPAHLRERFGAAAPIRYVEERHVGLSSARNAGLAAATGEIVVFTDDDVVVDPAWIGWIAAAFVREPAAACVTGLILPHDLSTESEVLIEQFAAFGKGFKTSTYSASNPTSALFPFAAGEFGSGACTAVRRDIALDLGGFDTALGAGTRARGGEDLDLYIRVLLAGHRLVYEPAAVIWHRHPDNPEHVRRELYSYGVGLSAMLTKQIMAGQAYAVLRRVPGAVRFLADPSSRKNVRKGPDYPGHYNWIERAGILVGPIAYLRSRRHEAILASRAGDRADEHYEPTWVGEIDIAEPLSELRPPAAGGGRSYRQARLFVRSGADPVGLVDIPLHGGSATVEKLSAELSGQLGGLGDSQLGHTDAQPTTAPPITVVVCTSDRPDSLRAALNSILATEYPTLDLLVVDNGLTTDPTVACVRDMADSRLRYVREPVRGLSAARNRGIHEATGEFIAFTDDDVVVDSNWLAAIAAGFARSRLVACVTGIILPAELETPAQAYFDSKVKWPANPEPRLFDLNHHRGGRLLFPYTAGEMGAGANFAVRRAALPSIGDFDEALGVGSRAMGGEDLDFFARVILAGWTLAYEPAALIWHMHRRDVGALERQMRAYGSGLSAYVFKHLISGSVLRHGVSVARHAPRQSLRFERGSRDATSSVAPSLRRIELAGIAAGPWLYVRGRWDVHRRARRRRAGLGAAAASLDGRSIP